MNFSPQSNKTLRRIAVTGMTASVYAMASLLLPIPQYGDIQCRLSEILNLLAFINPVFAPGVILGCFITNLFSPIPFDWLTGTFATALAMLLVTRTKNLLLATLWPTLCCIIIGAEVAYFLVELPFTLQSFAITSLSVMAGEFVAVTLIGYPLFRYLMKNERLMTFLRSF